MDMSFSKKILQGCPCGPFTSRLRWPENMIGDLQKISVFLLTTVEEVLRYVHDKTMLYLSEEVAVQMVVSIGRAAKSSERARRKIPDYFQ